MSPAAWLPPGRPLARTTDENETVCDPVCHEMYNDVAMCRLMEMLSRGVVVIVGPHTPMPEKFPRPLEGCLSLV